MCWAVFGGSVMSDSLQHHGLQPARLLCPWNSPGKNIGVGCHALLWGIFPTQGSNQSLLHCRRILYQLSYQGSPHYFITLRNSENLTLLFLFQRKGRCSTEAELFQGYTVSKWQNQDWNLGLCDSFYCLPLPLSSIKSHCWLLGLKFS